MNLNRNKLEKSSMKFNIIILPVFDRVLGPSWQHFRNLTPPKTIIELFE